MLLWLAILPYSLLTIGWGVVPVISLAALLLLGGAAAYGWRRARLRRAREKVVPSN